MVTAVERQPIRWQKLSRVGSLIEGPILEEASAKVRMLMFL